MIERLRIHHAVGSRVLLDSNRDEIKFTYRQEGSGYVFTISTDRTAAIDEILRLKQEINLFIFREVENVTVEKVWFYTGDGQVSFDDASKGLTIVAGSRLVYKPGDFTPS
jgi:hypothetical protein